MAGKNGKCRTLEVNRDGGSFPVRPIANLYSYLDRGVMKKFNSASLALLIALVPGLATASTVQTSSTPTHDGGHSFVLTGAIISSTVPGVWTPVSQGKHFIYACDNAMSKNNTPSTTSPANCKKLYEYSASGPSSTPASDLTNAVYDFNGPTYDPFATSSTQGRHIILASYFEDPPKSLLYEVWTASTEFTGAVAPTHDGGHSFSMSGSQVTTNPGTWTPANPDNLKLSLFSCTSAVPAENTPTTDYSPWQSICKPIFASDIVNPPTDLKAAFTASSVPYDSTVDGEHIIMISLSEDQPTFVEIVWSASAKYDPTSTGSSSSTASTSRPSISFQGPVLNTSLIPDSNRPGSQLDVPGMNLDQVKAVFVGETEVDFELIDGELLVVIPEDMEPGTYDLIARSTTADVTITDAITIAGLPNLSDQGPRASSVRTDNQVKVRFFNPVGAGKLQVFLNDEEIAWIDTDDANDPKLHLGYLVRSAELKPGKNAFEFFVEGQRVLRTAYWMD